MYVCMLGIGLYIMARLTASWTYIHEKSGTLTFSLGVKPTMSPRTAKCKKRLHTEAILTTFNSTLTPVFSRKIFPLTALLPPPLCPRTLTKSLAV